MGNTPTCVGNNLSLHDFASLIRKHPHMCGEYQLVNRCGLVVKGTPPHVWGILDQQQ